MGLGKRQQIWLCEVARTDVSGIPRQQKKIALHQHFICPLRGGARRHAPLALRRCAYTLPLCAAAVFSQAHNKLRSHSYHNSKLLVVADTDGRRERFRIRSVFSSLLRCQWGGKARSQSEAIVGPERIKRHASTLFRARQDCCRGLISFGAPLQGRQSSWPSHRSTCPIATSSPSADSME